MGENSDFGIINPDGTPRASTEAILKNGSAFLSDPTLPAPNVLLEYNRDTSTHLASTGSLSS